MNYYHALQYCIALYLPASKYTYFGWWLVDGMTDYDYINQLTNTWRYELFYFYLS